MERRLTRENVEEMARLRGLKMTPQRRLIVEFLQSAEHHPTAEEVFRAVNAKLPMASRATVYNTINWLKESGMVRAVSEGGEVRFDPNTSGHHHFVCRECGSITDVEPELFEGLNVPKLGGRAQVESVEVTLRGVCAACRTEAP